MSDLDDGGALDAVRSSMEEHLSAARAMLEAAPVVVALARAWWRSLEAGRSVFFCGNGGSAADAQHLAAELCGRFENERGGLPGLALTVDSSALTAIANDYGYERVFARQVEALVRPGDCVVCLSTSGNSPSILAAADSAAKAGAAVVGMTGAGGGVLAGRCEVCFQAPSARTARIQELHILAGHCCCQLIDRWHGKGRC